MYCVSGLAAVDSLKTYLKKHGGWAPNPYILIHTATTCALAKMLQRNAQGQVSAVTTYTPGMDNPTRSCLRDPLGINMKFLTDLQKKSGCLQDQVLCRPLDLGQDWI